MNKTILIAIAGLILSLASAHAQTLTFSNDPPSGVVEQFSSLPSDQYVEDGFVLSASNTGNPGNSGIATPSWQGYSVDGSNFLYNGNNNLTLAEQSGGNFAFSSVQYYNPSSNGSLTLTLYGYSGTTLIGTDTFTLAAGGSGTLTGDLSGINSLVFATPPSGSDFALDNLTLTAAPEPGLVSLLVGGFLVLGLWSRRSALPGLLRNRAC